MNRLQFLEDTVNMLTAQGVYAYANGSCQYKTSSGHKCAIGLHIPDELYDSNMKGNLSTLFFHYPEVRDYISGKYGDISVIDMQFLNHIQAWLHDDRAIAWMPLATAEETREMFRKDLENTI